MEFREDQASRRSCHFRPAFAYTAGSGFRYNTTRGPTPCLRLSLDLDHGAQNWDRGARTYSPRLVSIQGEEEKY